MIKKFKRKEDCKHEIYESIMAKLASVKVDLHFKGVGLLRFTL